MRMKRMKNKMKSEDKLKRKLKSSCKIKREEELTVKISRCFECGVMSLGDLFKKATSAIFSSIQSENRSHPLYQDGETILCKNNVCVHPASILREDYDLVHHPGYLTIHYRTSRSVPGLHLVWVPNATIHKTYQNRRSHSLNRYDSADSTGDRQRPRCLSHTSRDSLESECSGCSPSIDNNDNVSLDSSTSDTVTVIDTASHDIKPHGRDSSDTNSETTNDVPTIDNIGATENEKTGSEDFKGSMEPMEKCGETIGTAVTDTNQCTPSPSNNKDTKTLLDSKTNADQTEKHQNGHNGPTFYHGNRNNSSTNVAIERHHISRNKKSKCQTSSETIENSEQAGDEDNNCDRNISEKDTDHDIEERDRNVEIDTVERIRHQCDELIDRLNRANTEDLVNDFKGAIEETVKTDVKDSTETNDKSEEIPIGNGNTPQQNDHTSNKNSNSSSHDKLTRTARMRITSFNSEEDTDEMEVFNIETIKQVNSEYKNNVNMNRNHVNSERMNVNNQVNSSFTQNVLGQESVLSNGSTSMSSHSNRFNITHSLPSSPYLSRNNKKSCKKFAIDLNEMKSLRLFFCDAAKTKGQFVIASRESQYKILHFHHGGLNKLAKLLNEWNFVKTRSNQPGEVLPYEHFMVYQPCVSDTELHPEEYNFPEHIDLLSFFNTSGQIEDEFSFRKYIFFNGVPSKLRSLVWPFLLNYYAYNTTSAEREQIVRRKRTEYADITRSRLELSGEKREEFCRSIESVVEKDVIRTDRGNPFYAGEGNPHVETMKNILLNYALYDAGLGYTQGMSDLLAPVLVEIREESDAFWCFTGLLKRGLFVCTPTDSDMEQNLNYFRELIRIMEPTFYEHLTRHVDAMELLFCHRWILLCFKREFQTEAALTIWESCWSSYATEYFHLFVCLAIVSVYGNDVVAQNLRTDEMLLHFSSLANYMDAKLILRKARGLVHNFRQLSVIPCTLVRLCQQCGPGIWDSSHVPNVVCQSQESCDCNYQTTE
uniref:TBC1 domain family member 16 n=1 Tax=Cacopsylla melanoneura TaxID=428564 RepID=A0A8D8M7Z2_9HEMI